MADPTDTPLRQRLDEILSGATVDPQSRLPPAATKATALARLLQTRAAELQTPQERRQQAELERMMASNADKVTLIEMTDQAFRSENPERAADQLTHILDVQGVPRFFSPFDRALLKGFQSFGNYLPGVAVPLVKDKMREETANVVLPAERDHLARHLAARNAAGIRMNVNLLGEALLGEAEAEQRLENYLAALQLPEIEVISVKVSTLYSQISAVALEHTIGVLSNRLELLYRAAAKERFRRRDGTEVPKFVYLDMEEYRDMEVTARAFMETLDRPGLEHVSAGIALQAYLPDAIPVQRRIHEWASKRVARGGAPVTIRVVKGANMEMERVEASIAGWPQAPYRTKIEVDANYKRMLHEGLDPEYAGAIRLGVASHNLFDVAYGLVLAVERDAIHRVQFEMLEGMANHQRRALQEITESLLLYAPATRREDFIHAIGYLVRRLDENTGPDNFLRHAFKLEVGSNEWEALETDFYRAFEVIDDLPATPRRTQDRAAEERAGERPDLSSPLELSTFSNEPDTDFSLPANVAWAERIVREWKPRCGDRARILPIVIDGESIAEGRELRDSEDPSRPGVVVARCAQATSDDAARAIRCAREDADAWRALPVEERAARLAQVANEVRAARGDLIGACMAEGGKTIVEADPEVSEAVDFLEYYGRSAAELSQLEGLDVTGKGVAMVVPPWNFPLAIPCGGVAAALAAGNTVILKPASDAVLVGALLCECFWRAGVPRRALQFIAGGGSTIGAEMVSHPDVDCVILTGGTATALAMLNARPAMHLIAETGGKNATIVTALADRELAIRHVVQSAFGHAGQKCSATSLLILEEEVYADEEFRRTLCDAVTSLAVGSAWDLETRVNPMIRPPRGELETALKELESGESWAVRPRQREGNPRLYSPGVKWDVSPDSFTHLTEFFGPVLGVMRARHLRDAVALANQTGYGLTSGLESLDDREQAQWLEGIRAGNLYINRVTTGAIVSRQPFGGMGKSGFGPGIKVGGPNYVAQLMNFRSSGGSPRSEEIDDPLLAGLRREMAEHLRSPGEFAPAEVEAIIGAIESYDYWVRTEFGRTHDDVRLLGQDNLRRYRPVDALRIRVHEADTAFELFARVAAARAAGCRSTVSLPPGSESAALSAIEVLTERWAAAIEFVEEDDADLVDAIRGGQTDRIRYAQPERAPGGVLAAAGERAGIFVAREPVLAHGRIELLWYLREQSISRDYHRYGNLGARGQEERSPVL